MDYKKIKVVIAAAGEGRRSGLSIPKRYIKLGYQFE